MTAGCCVCARLTVVCIVCVFKCRVLGCWVWPGHTVTRVIRFTRLSFFPTSTALPLFLPLCLFLNHSLHPSRSANLSHTPDSEADTPWFSSCGNTYCTARAVESHWERFGCLVCLPAMFADKPSSCRSPNMKICRNFGFILLLRTADSRVRT